MGMMEQGQQPQQMQPQQAPQQAPQQGMMGGQQAPEQGGGGGYNGVVSVNGKPVQVTQGVANMDGKNYLVSDDGSMVVDQDQRIVGYIENAQFKPMDAEHAAQLEQAGVTE
jgi:hypothetical protein